MTSIHNEHDQSTFLRKLNDLAHRYNLPIRSKQLLDRLVADLPETITQSTTDTAIYGFRTEAMFAYTAAALQGCNVIHQEDSGMRILHDDVLAPPDYRILTRNNVEFFVEVKNHHKWPKPFRVREDYLFKLQHYAKTFRKPLKFAIYWPQWNTWSLVDPKFFSKNGNGREINFGPAMLRNEMVVLGDCLLATIPPLSIRVYADSQQPRSVNADGVAQFRVGKISLYADGNEISDSKEKAIAFYLMLFGNWRDQEEHVKLEDDLSAYFEIIARPRQVDEDHRFQGVGYFSSMISNCYAHYTVENGVVERLTPGRDANKLLVSIPDEYHGDELHLQRFYMYPKHARGDLAKDHWCRLRVPQK